MSKHSQFTGTVHLRGEIKILKPGGVQSNPVAVFIYIFMCCMSEGSCAKALHTSV